ncbi:MAG: hypothetical protein HUM72_12500 [Dolichospermum sp.]|nr:hypothetical protein [Dolichospermum sp.]
MKSSITDRNFDSYRPANNDKSKIAVTTEEDSSGLIVDQANSTTLYLGEGLYGALTSESKWKIKRIDLSSGVVIKAASQDFDQIWDNRASLTYV